MRTLIYFSSALFFCALLYTPQSYAGDAVETMANIVIGLKHFPSDADKASLAAIAESDDSDAVKALANAIANVSHTVTDADKATLAAIIADEGTAMRLKELAVILNNFAHMPSAETVASLQGLADN